MKKFLLTLMVMGITSSSAFAYYEVNYMNTGAVKNFTPVQFGQNAAWLPHNRAEHSQRVREVKRYNAVTKAIENQNNYNYNYNINLNKTVKTDSQASTVSEDSIASTDSNSTTTVKTKSVNTPVTCNGITYYNGTNSCTIK